MCVLDDLKNGSRQLAIMGEGCGLRSVFPAQLQSQEAFAGKADADAVVLPAILVKSQIDGCHDPEIPDVPVGVSFVGAAFVSPDASPEALDAAREFLGQDTITIYGKHTGRLDAFPAFVVDLGPRELYGAALLWHQHAVVANDMPFGCFVKAVLVSYATHVYAICVCEPGAVSADISIWYAQVETLADAVALDGYNTPAHESFAVGMVYACKPELPWWER